MDFYKFIDLLNSSELFFSRPDKFNDPFEGSLTTPSSQYLDKLIAEKAPKKRVKLGELFKSISTVIGINCWHMNQSESDAMWKLYLEKNEGIAVQSTFSQLAKCFSKSDQIVNIGCVTYVDYETHHFNLNTLVEGDEFSMGLDPIDLFTHKRLGFEHENELRAITISDSLPGRKYTGDVIEIHKNSEIDNGVRVSVDLACMIESVYISPQSPTWFRQLVVDTIDKSEYNIPIKPSSLQGVPKY